MYRFKNKEHSYDLIQRRFKRTYMGETFLDDHDLIPFMEAAIDKLPDDSGTAAFKEYWFTDLTMSEVGTKLNMKTGAVSVYCRDALYRLRNTLIPMVHGERSIFTLKTYHPSVLAKLAKAGYDSVDKLTELTADQLFVDYNIGFPDINQIAMALDKQFGLKLTPNATDTSDPKYRRIANVRFPIQ